MRQLILSIFIIISINGCSFNDDIVVKERLASSRCKVVEQYSHGELHGEAKYYCADRSEVSKEYYIYGERVSAREYYERSIRVIH